MSKHRNYAFIVYPENNSIDIISDFLDTHSIPAFISPLHDKDFDTNNQLKKPHYHILLNFSYPIEYNSVISLLSPFNINFLTVVYSSSSYYRYLCHLDNPEKAQYSLKDIRPCGGARALQVGRDQCTAGKLEELLDIIECKNIGELSELVAFLLREKNTEMLEFVCKKSFLVDRIVTSSRYKNHKLQSPTNAVR